MNNRKSISIFLLFLVMSIVFTGCSSDENLSADKVIQKAIDKTGDLDSYIIETKVDMEAEDMTLEKEIKEWRDGDKYRIESKTEVMGNELEDVLLYDGETYTLYIESEGMAIKSSDIQILAQIYADVEQSYIDRAGMTFKQIEEEYDVEKLDNEEIDGLDLHHLNLIADSGEELEDTEEVDEADEIEDAEDTEDVDSEDSEDSEELDETEDVEETEEESMDIEEAIWLDMEDYIIRKQIAKTKDVEMTTQVTNFEKNPSFEDDIFELEIPEDIEILDLDELIKMQEDAMTEDEEEIDEEDEELDNIEDESEDVEDVEDTEEVEETDDVDDTEDTDGEESDDGEDE